MPIHFGTDGWRAVISDSFTFDNLRIVTQAIADAVASDHWNKSPGVDPRLRQKCCLPVLVSVIFR